MIAARMPAATSFSSFDINPARGAQMRRAEPAACDDLRRMSPCQSAALNGLEGQFQRAVVLVDSVGTGRAPAGLLRHHHSDGKQDLGVNSRTEQHASTSTASPQGVGFSNTPAGGVSAVTVTAEGALDEYRFNMFMNDLMAEKKSDIVGFKGVLCVQGCGNTKFVVRGSREGLGYGPAEQEWQPLEQRINQMVFIGRGLDREELTAGFSTCVHAPAPPAVPLPLWPGCIACVPQQAQAWGATC
ncbi:hypothetical protein CHLRE_16g685000v5 [Chlamydomonas reinhardtii]|uniref:Uncharacterized protein n=1 Tax=Chlamydomonas reinhardtii TaxID=3055 RepID=A8IS97_CHLRE|nr:uncharacterized protein CHLRE_16g685000v5 [Chlamydomonas reinhardtii]PNW72038.1 hypothetical protein CHLRE_16g685000v5 [Chlamydomonas reinhardtii]|eukprot:XP_001691930.1 PRLI-interacting factor L [Chlamydomonas reinhardtii]